MKILLLILFASLGVQAQSFYVLTDVESYDPIVANMSPKTQRYSDAIKSLMQGVSKELGVDTSGHPSRVLVFVISDISVGDTVGLKVDLELGEYVHRKGGKQAVFALTYKDTRLLAPDFKDEEDVEDQLADATEEMLEAFKLQYQEDNQKYSKEQKPLSHEDFATQMQYFTDYNAARLKAKKEGKALMLFMTTSYCPWCRKLENRILSQTDIDTKIKAKYVPVMLNIDVDTFPKQFAKTRFTPILYIVNSSSETIEKEFVGYSSRDAFLQLFK